MSLVLVALGQAPALASPPSLHELTLKNGLHVVIDVDHRRPRVGTAVAYDAGLGTEPRGARGLATLAANAIELGSSHVDDSPLPLLERAGATVVGAVTTEDQVVFSETMPARNQATALWQEADRMAFAIEALTPERLESARSQTRNAFYVAHGDALQGKLASLLTRLLFPVSHPYRGMGAIEDLDAIELEHLQWFVQQHYRPETATLAIVGDVDERTLETQVHRYFDSVQISGSPAAHVTPKPLSLEREVKGVARDSMLVEGFTLAWPGPPEGPALDALTVAASCLSATTGPLESGLVRQGHGAVGIRVGVSRYGEESLFFVRVLLKLGEELAPVEELVEREVTAFAMAPSRGCDLSESKADLVEKLRASAGNFQVRAQNLARHRRAFATALADMSGLEKGFVEKTIGTYLVTSRRALLEHHWSRLPEFEVSQ